MTDPQPEPQPQPEPPAPEMSKAEKRAKSWQETKTDFKWATALLFVLILAISGYLWASWSKVPAGEENLNDMTDGIFSTSGTLLVPFEILSVLLLAALIAGVVIALRDADTEVE